MEVHGIDLARGAYRVSFEAEGRTIRGLVPESLVQEGPRPGHSDVYEWIATHQSRIEKTLLALATGRPQKIRAPYDRLTLE